MNISINEKHINNILPLVISCFIHVLPNYFQNVTISANIPKIYRITMKNKQKSVWWCAISKIEMGQFCQQNFGKYWQNGCSWIYIIIEQSGTVLRHKAQRYSNRIVTIFMIVYFQWGLHSCLQKFMIRLSKIIEKMIGNFWKEI